MKCITILLAEDNFGDQKLFSLALKDSEDTELRIVSDGREAIQFLRKEGKYLDAPRPDLVVLDFNLPRMSGPEILATIRREPTMEHLPVAIFTGSKPARELAEICKLNANFYVTKPDTADRYFAVVQAFQHYCRSILQFPKLNKEYANELRQLLENR